jgi:hypothetical protein
MQEEHTNNEEQSCFPSSLELVLISCSLRRTCSEFISFNENEHLWITLDMNCEATYIH